MTEKRFKIVHLRDWCVCDIQDTSQDVPTFYNDLTWNMGSAIQICDLLNKLSDENEQLKQYKQSVSDVLLSWSQKNLTAKQLQVVIAIMEELNVMGDVE